MTSPAKIRRRILVVDDDRALNVGLVGLLKTFGHAATGVYDGASAVKRVDRDSFDLVLLDMGLPKVDGLDVLKHLRKKQPALKIIIMTADDTPETVLDVVKEQAYQFISKPTPPKEIAQTVEQALSSADVLPIEVVSAKPDWLELVVPCQLEIADRIESFVQGLTLKLSEQVRESVGRAFRELLMNAIEWGGQFDTSGKSGLPVFERTGCSCTGYRIRGPALNQKVFLTPLSATIRVSLSHIWKPAPKRVCGPEASAFS
jgi:DNA-binding response OmpR family regulator